MFNCCDDFQKYYDADLRLGAERRSGLANVRDANLKRIKDGLADIANETGESPPKLIEYKNQGGYAMHTLNQAENNDYDIDVAVIFKKEDLPNDPIAAKNLIKEALLKRSANFVTEPEARKNAVTVWYEDGYHIDFAIYRCVENTYGTSVEHASDVWTARSPMEVNEWFCASVDEKSPDDSPFLTLGVHKKQMRRIVRYVKRFCKSRNSWNLPGGMIISTLINEVYVPDRYRDDVSLRVTMGKLKARLESSQVVWSPVRRDQELSGSEKHKKQIARLLSKLQQFIPKLDVLDKDSCTNEDARTAWNFIFNHGFWKRTSTIAFEDQANLARTSGWLSIDCGLARSKGGPVYKGYSSNSYLLPKGLGLRFTVGITNVAMPYKLKWRAQNEGDEAVEAGQIEWTREESICWTSTQYRGIQKMTAEIWKDDVLVATDTFIVKIA